MNSSIFSDFLNSAWDAEAQFLSTKKGSPCSITERRGCDLNPARSVPESSTLSTRLPSHSTGVDKTNFSCSLLGCCNWTTKLLQSACLYVRPFMYGRNHTSKPHFTMPVSFWMMSAFTWLPSTGNRTYAYSDKTMVTYRMSYSSTFAHLLSTGK